jgi:hypothetical protein
MPGAPPHDSRTSARPRRAGRPHRSAVPGGVGPLRITRGSRRPRPRDIRPGAPQAANPALRGRHRVSPAGVAKHLLQLATHRGTTATDHSDARRDRPGGRTAYPDCADSELDARERSTAELDAPSASQALGRCKHESSSPRRRRRATAHGQNRPRGAHSERVRSRAGSPRRSPDAGPVCAVDRALFA